MDVVLRRSTIESMEQGERTNGWRPWRGWLTRLDRRRALRVPVRLACGEQAGERSVPAVACDLSEEGVAVRRLGGERPADVVLLEFALPGSGEVIRARAETQFATLKRGVHRAGMRFVAMAPKHVRLVRDFLMDRRLRALGRRSWLSRLSRWF
jgi:c-di-GMP-binding flagellar brake protein YcgR